MSRWEEIFSRSGRPTVQEVRDAVLIEFVDETQHDAMMTLMRTTLTIPDDIYVAARSLAHHRELSIGDALAELARRGLQSSPPIDTSKAFPCFAKRDGAKPITLEHGLDIEDEW